MWPSNRPLQPSSVGQETWSGLSVVSRTRNDADYPRIDSPELSGEDVVEDLPKARAIVEAMTRLIEHLEPW